MIIKRTIDNKEYEFELTAEERVETYNEYRKFLLGVELEWFIPQYLEINDEITEADIRESYDFLLDEWADICDHHNGECTDDLLLETFDRVFR